MNHVVSTCIIAGLLLLGIGACAGVAAGILYGPSYYEAVRVEQRLREVFCEQAVKNKLLNSCEVFR